MKKIILAVMMILILQIDVFAAAGLKLGKLTIDDIKKNIMTIEQLETAKILNVEIQELNDTIATIFWQTDTFSTVNINYGLEYPPKNNIIKMDKGLKHLITLENLEPGSRYYFTIKGEEEYRGIFNTTGLQLPKLRKLNYHKIDIDAINVELIFNLPIKGNLIYWQYNAPNDKKEIALPDYSDSYIFELKNLKADAAYNFIFSGVDKLNRKISVDTQMITTKENNIALNKPIIGTFIVKLYDMRGDSEKIINRINDGSTNYFDGIATSENLVETDQYFILDLEQIYDLKLLIAYWRKLCYPTNYKIEISEDSETWLLLADNINASRGFDQNADTGDPMLLVMTSGQNKKARYIKLTCKKGEFWVKHQNWTFVQLNEFKVFPN